MAGIGFELRKIFGRRTLVSQVWGSIYATMTTIGPSIIFILLLFSVRFALSHFGAGELQSMFFISSFTYVFMTAILAAALFNTVLSRYISDKVFEKKEDDLGAALFGTMTMGSMITGIVMLVFCILMYVQDEVPLEFLLVYYLLGILATNAYNIITFISALKQYKEITLSYLGGLLISVPCFFVFYKILGMQLIMAIYTVLVIAFLLTNTFLVYWCIKAFGKPSDKYFEFLGYFRRFPKLMISGFAYMLGFYITNIIYWIMSDLSIKVSIFRTAPNYDLAMFLAILVNLSALVIFVVKTESAFYEKYVSYLSALNRGTYELIVKEKEKMENTIRLQLFFIYEVQLIIVILLVCLANVFFPYLGVSLQVLNIFMLLAMGLYCVLCMYFTVIFLYYFEDHMGALIPPCVFLGIVTVGAFICAGLGDPFYPVPLIIGGIVGWILSFILLKRRLNNLSAYLLSR